jgi:hypothetical protein
MADRRNGMKLRFLWQQTLNFLQSFIIIGIVSLFYYNWRIIVVWMLMSAVILFITGYIFQYSVSWTIEIIFGAITIASIITIWYIFYKKNIEERRKMWQIATDSRWETMSQTYIDQTSELLHKSNFPTSQLGVEARNIIRKQTLAVLEILDQEHKKQLLQFLIDSKLVIHPTVTK